MAKMDETTWVYLMQVNSEAMALLAAHVSPENAHSWAKGIPMNAANLTIVRKLGLQTGIRVRYRGPRSQVYGNGNPNRDARRLTCLQKDATSFAVYPR